MMNVQLPDRDDLPEPPPAVKIVGGALAALMIGVAIGTVALIVIGFLMAKLG